MITDPMFGTHADGYSPIVAFCDSPEDARLIAAAPDLLAACERALSALACNPKFRENEPTIAFARAAIAKAKGGAA